MKTVVAALLVRDGKLLVCQRRATDAFPLKWEFPGGKVSPGESLAAALVRELHEELGIRAHVGAEVYRTRHHYAEHAKPLELVFYRVLPGDEEPRNLVFEQIRWVAPEALPDLDLLDGDRELVSLLARRAITVE